jgi:superfamily II DNA or RNA helicase
MRAPTYTKDTDEAQVILLSSDVADRLGRACGNIGATMTPTTHIGLRTLDLNDHYRSDEHDVVSGFFVPVLATATRYDRAVGYFSSSSLALYAYGLESFAERQGRMRLIASPALTEDDITDIQLGYDLREVVTRAAMRELDDDQDDTSLDRLGILGRLIANGSLDIKLAFVQRGDQIGVYHEKIGVLRDDLGDIVAFTGSSNETYGGLMANFESVEVYCGWVSGEDKRARRIESNFQSLWQDQTDGLSVVPFPEVARNRLIQLAQERAVRTARTPEPLEVQPVTARILSTPDWLTARPYQKEAVEAWLSNKGRGILKMATGTGKTKTALIAATQLGNLYQAREEPLVVLILAPFQHLVDQWIEDVQAFGVMPVGVYESSMKWVPQVEEQLTESRLGRRPATVIVATNKSFSGVKFQSVLSRITQPLLVIADEAHNLGSATYVSALPGNATYRLALSATPERWFDDEGTDALIEYFGPVVFEMGLGDAIEAGALCRYDYHPRLIELDPSETEFYVGLTAKIGALLAAGESLKDADPDSTLGFLLRQRAAVLGHAGGKLDRLRHDLEARKNDWFQLVYCAEGRKPLGEGEHGPRQLNEALGMIGRDLRLPAHPYVAETPRTERRKLLRRFGSGDDLRVLVSMKCLDEGVDIPDARIGYLLASSSNPRQFIQRRGRLLRLAPGKERAHIFDYLAVPGAGAPVNFDVERSLLIRELERSREFASLAENYGATLDVLRPLKERYHLMHL